MALNSIPIPPDARRDAKARELVKTAHLWHVVTLRKPWGSFKVGDQFLQTPNGYRVNAVACQCADYLVAGNICKHVRCVAMLDQQARSPRPVVCEERGCQEERAKGARYCRAHWLADAW